MSLYTAVTPDQAAESLSSFVEGFGLDRTGEYWAPRGPGYVPFLIPEHFGLITNLDRDIGTAEATLGRDLPTPLQLPW